MDIDKLISEYNNFIKNYEKGEMFKIRNTMRQLSHIIVSKLNATALRIIVPKLPGSCSLSNNNILLPEIVLSFL